MQGSCFGEREDFQQMDLMTVTLKINHICDWVKMLLRCFLQFSVIVLGSFSKNNQPDNKY